jgi:hypothetical protein
MAESSLNTTAEAVLDGQKQQVKAIAQPTRGEDRSLHIEHIKLSLHLEYALSGPIGRADEHQSDKTTNLLPSGLGDPPPPS